VGKSTIIDQYIKLNQDKYKIISGFKTKELILNDSLLGYYLEDQSSHSEDYQLVGINILYPNGRKSEGVTNAFDTRGVEILNHAINNECDLIILDELGFFELEAKQFINKVYELLDTEKRVLGVLKKKTNTFLESIKNRKDVIVIEVTINNRDKVINELKSHLEG